MLRAPHPDLLRSGWLLPLSAPMRYPSCCCRSTSSRPIIPGDHEAEGSVRCFCGTGTCHQRHFDHGSSCAGQRRCDLVCDASHGAAGHALRRFDDPQIHKGFAGRYHLCRYLPLKAMHPR